MRTFAEEANVLFIANKEYGTVRQSSPKGIGYLKDFYTVDTIDEKDSAEVEKNLSTIESTCLPLINKLKIGDDLSDSEWADIAIYMAVQYGRTPYARARMDEVATIITTNELKQKLADAINNPDKYNELVEAVSTNNPSIHMPSRDELVEWVLKPGPLAKISIDNGTYVQSFFRIAWEIADGLLNTRWIVLHAPRGSSFITSDNPMALSINRELSVYETLAILLPGVVRHFPLDSRTCLMMVGERTAREIQHNIISKNEVRKINKLIYSQALKYVISGNKTLLDSLTTRPTSR